MNYELEYLIEKLKEYKKELDLLWQGYNNNDSGLKLELLACKMSVIFYNYFIECFNTLCDSYKEKYYFNIRKCFTILTYCITCTSITTAPIVTLPALLASIGLTIKNKEDLKFKKTISEEQEKELLDLIRLFEDDYSPKIDSIFDQVDIYEDNQFLEDLPEPEKSKRMACKKLMRFLRKEDNTIFMEDEIFQNYLIELINDSLNLQENDLYTLIQKADNKYQELENQLIVLTKKEDRINRLYRHFI